MTFRLICGLIGGLLLAGCTAPTQGSPPSANAPSPGRLGTIPTTNSPGGIPDAVLLTARADSGTIVGPSGSLPGQAEFTLLPAFITKMGRPMAFIPIFLPMGQTLPIESLQRADALGARPLIDLGCAAVGPTAAGANDAALAALAATIKAFGKPVFVRWYWEFSHADPAHTTRSCDAAGNGPGFAAAWRHLAGVLKAAPNVSLVWCPSAGDKGAALYYPGDDVVDWIGGDGFARDPGATFDSVFGAWYAAFASHGKPMMIGATGAIASDQQSYIDEIRLELPSKYPLIRAVNYFNAAGGNGDFTLVGSGLDAFKALAADASFQGS